MKSQVTINKQEFEEMRDFLDQMEYAYSDIIDLIEDVLYEVEYNMSGIYRDKHLEEIFNFLQDLKTREPDLINDLKDELQKYNQTILIWDWVTISSEDKPFTVEFDSQMVLGTQVMNTEMKNMRLIVNCMDIPSKAYIAWDILGDERDELEDYVDIKVSQMKSMQDQLQNQIKDINDSIDRVKEIIRSADQIVDNDSHVKASMNHSYAYAAGIITIGIIAVVQPEIVIPILSMSGSTVEVTGLTITTRDVCRGINTAHGAYGAISDMSDVYLDIENGDGEELVTDSAIIGTSMAAGENKTPGIPSPTPCGDLAGSIISGWISGEADDALGSEEKLEYGNSEEVTVSSEEIIEYSNNQKIDIEKIEIPEQVKINIGMVG